MPFPHQALFNSISALDIELLAEILYDDPQYALVKKNLLIKELTTELNKLKAVGDTYLEQYQLNCDLADCCVNAWPFQTFIGDKSLKHFDLIFRHKNDELLDIEIGQPLCLNKLIEVAIYIEGKRPPIEYSEVSEEEHYYSYNLEAGVAIIELETASESEPLSFQYTEGWLNTYSMLRTYLGESQVTNFPNLIKFIGIFEELTALHANKASAEDAMIGFKIANKQQHFILAWLCQHEDLALWALRSNHPLFHDLDNKEREYFSLSLLNPLPLRLSDYKHVLDFYNIVDKLYFEVFDRVKKNPLEECAKIAKLEGLDTRIYHLSYHLGISNKHYL